MKEADLPERSTPEEAGEFLRKSQNTLKNWRNLRIGPNYIKIGNSVLYEKQDLIDYVRAGKVIVSPRYHS